MSMDMLLQAAEFLECGTGGTKSTTPRANDTAASAQALAKQSGRERTRTISNSSTGSQRSSDEGKAQRRPGGAGTREVHNKLEKNRRAHLKTCFEQLKAVIPNLEDRKSSNLSILRLAIRHIQYLKRKEKEYELETQKLARDKIVAQERIATLRRELAHMGMEVDLVAMINDDDDSHSDSTATADGEEPIVSDTEDDVGSSRRAQAAAEEAAAKIMPPPPTPPYASHKGPVLASSNKMHQIAPKGDSALGSKQMTSLIQLAAKPNVMVASPTVAKNTGPIPVSPTGAKMNFISTSMPNAGATNQPTIVLSNAVLNKSPANGAAGQALTLSVSQNGNTAAQPTGLAAQKPAVAQLLQQQIQQRAIQQQIQQHVQQLQQQHQVQQLQQQQQQQQQQHPQAQKFHNGQPQGTFITLGNNNLKPLAQLPRGVTLNSVVPTIVPGGTSILAAAAAQANIPTTPTTPTAAPATVSNLAASSPFNRLINTTMANNFHSVPNAIVTSVSGEQLVHHAPGLVTTPTAVTGVIPTGATTSAAATTVSLANMKPLTQIPIQLISPAAAAQMATLQQLVNQAVNLPRGTAPVSVTGANPTTPTASVPASPTVTQIPTIHPVTPVLSPLILSPSVLTQSGLNQAQLAQVSAGNIVSSPLLKTFGQIPIIQQPLTLSPAGLVKPMVMVTMPSVVAANTTAPTSAAAASTPSVPVSNSS